MFRIKRYGVEIELKGLDQLLGRPKQIKYHLQIFASCILKTGKWLYSVHW